jgi:hypothetical protein
MNGPVSLTTTTAVPAQGHRPNVIKQNQLATPQLFAAVAALQHLCNGADDLHVSPPPMWPLLLHAAMTHPMGTRAEIATAIASTTVESCRPLMYQVRSHIHSHSIYI